MTKSRQNAAGIVKVSFYSGEMAKQGEGFSYKCSRIAGIKICNPNFHKELVTFDHSCSSGQQNCSSISWRWVVPQFTPFKNQQVNLELSAISSDHNYYRVPSKHVVCQNRLRV